MKLNERLLFNHFFNSGAGLCFFRLSFGGSTGTKETDRKGNSKNVIG